MRKRERENPCGICGHYHKYEEGETCGVCGHRPPVPPTAEVQLSCGAYPSEILKEFLYLGSYDNASQVEVLNTMGISCILNTVPACQTLYKNYFIHHCLEDGTTLQFENAIQFLEQCEKDKARVLVHCMSGKNRSPAIVIAYLMKSRGWRFAQCLQWVNERRPTIALSSDFQQQLLEYEKKIFERSEQKSLFPSPSSLAGFTFPMPISTTIPSYNQLGTASIFERACPNVTGNQFVFGASGNNDQVMVANAEAHGSAASPEGTGTSMDSC